MKDELVTLCGAVVSVPPSLQLPILAQNVARGKLDETFVSQIVLDLANRLKAGEKFTVGNEKFDSFSKAYFVSIKKKEKITLS